ncbi:MAG: bifunctional nicotinamidase/pyrazinamidase [Qingshengfaniella sp.]
MASTTTALLVIDVQNDFCEGGALAVPDGSAVVALINTMMADADTVILTQDWHPAGHSSFATQHPGKAPLEVIKLPYGDQVLWPDHCVQGTTGADFHPGLDVARARAVIRKGMRPGVDSYSAFFENDRATPTGLEGYLRSLGVTRLTLAGLALDFCVGYSALDAARLGFEVEVITGACRAIDAGGSLAGAQQAMAAAGVVLR